MFQQCLPFCERSRSRRLSGYLLVLAALFLTLVSPRASAQAACNVVYTISPQNTSAFGAAITIQNTGTTAWTSWTLTWTFANGQTVSSLWNGIESQSGANVTVTNEPYNGSVAAGGSVQGVGFNGTWNGATNAVPASFAVNGVTCGGTKTATTTALTASTTTPKVGASVTLTATVTPTAATGTVTFYSGTTSLGTGTLASGVATLATSFAAAGTDSLTAVYAGSTTYATSTSSAVSVTVSTTATTTALTASTTTPKVGASVTLTATVSPTAATGTVTFYSGTTSLGTGTLASGVATLATSFAAAGTDSLTAVYAGSAAYATSTSSAVSVTVSAATTTTTLTASTTTPAVGASVTLTATVAPTAATGTVTFYSGTTSLGTGTLSSGVATLATSFATAGTYSLTAVYAGSTNYATSTSSAVSVTASAKTATTTALTATASVKVGASTTLTATVTPTAATGTVTFYSGTTSLGTGTLSSGVATLTTSYAAAGTYSLTAVYAGSTTYATSTSSAVSVTVTTTATTTTLTASNTTPAVGASVTLTATVAPTAATGTVTFYSGTTSLGTGTLSSGVATLATSFATSGTDSLTAVYGGSAAYATSTSSAVSITVSPAGGFTLTPASATETLAPGASVTDAVTVTDTGGFTGTVTLTATSSNSGVTVTVSGDTLTIAASSTATGTATITVTGTSGTTTATSSIAVTVTSTSASFSLWATAATLSIAQNDSGSDTINVLGANGFNGAVTLVVSGLPTGVTASLDANPTTGTSGLILAVSSSAAAATSTITITGTSGTLTASTTIALTVTSGSAAGSFTLTPSSATLSIAAGSSSIATINIADVSPFSGSVTLAASGLPTGVTAAWTSNPSTSGSTLTLTAASTAAAGTSTITITGTSGSVTATTTISLTVTAATGMACSIVYTVSGQSVSGTTGYFGGNLTINNTGTVGWTNWTLTWTYANGQVITNLWGGVLTQTGANISIVAESYDAPIAAGGSLSSVGFNASWNAVTNAQPTNFAINGTTCSATGGSGFTLLASASPVTLNQGSSSTDSISVEDFGGFTGSVTLAATGLPTGVTAAFGANPTTGSSTVTFTAAASLPAALTSVTITGTSGSTTASTIVGLNVAGYTSVSVNSTTKGIAVSDQILGMDMAAWYDIVTNADVIVDSFKTAGIKSVRWPGGSWSDVYHWATNTNCQNAPYGGGTPDVNDTFANFVNDLVIPAGLDVALTADYGTNPACTGGGVPSEAAAWVTAALADGITVSHMTVGNEVYGATWEEDLHSPANNAAEYASTIVGSSGFYEAIKTASPNTLVGVVVDLDNTVGGWDNTVLANAKGYYDFVEYHYYPEAPGFENDSTLINQDAQLLTTNLNTLKAELAEWGTPNTPIYVGEIGGPYGTPGRQSMSITQALYAGQVLGEMMNDGMTRLTWWIGYGGCADMSYSGNYSSTLYGWQSFGGYMVFSDGLTDYYQCTAETLAPGILLPTARAFQLFSNLAVTGENVLSATVSGDTADVVAYAATHSGGTALFLVNRNEFASQQVAVTLSGQTTATSVTVETYDKAIYDLSGSPSGTFPDPAGTSTWAPPTTTTISSPTLPLSLTLPPWSMNVVIIH